MGSKIIRLMGLLLGFSFASFANPIVLGSLSTYALYAAGANINFSSPGGSTNVLNGLSFTSATPAAGTAVNFVGGGSFVTPIPSSASTAFGALQTALNGLSYTAESSLTGLGPGDYSFSSAGAVPLILNLSTPGQYVFRYTGLVGLTLTNVVINLGPGVSSDDVFWYLPGASIQLNNGAFAGDIVTGGGAQIVANTATAGLTVTDLSRVFSAGAMTLDSLNGDKLNFDTRAASAAVPEPVSEVSLGLGLIGMAFAIRRRR